VVFDVAMKRCPNLFILGAMKCGTTSLHNYLDMHPDVCMSSDKEPHYLSFNCYHYSADDFYSLWSTDSRYLGESSTSYSKLQLAPDTPQRIRTVSPEAKFIYMVRDPVDRMQSHYNHSVACSMESESPEVAFTGDLSSNNYVLTSSYFLQIKRYIDIFGSDRILIIDSDELRIDRDAVMGQVYSFLGLPAVDLPNLEKDYHRTADLGKDRVLVKYLRKNRRLMKGIKRLFPRKWLSFVGKKPQQLVLFSDTLRGQLYDYLYSDMEQFKEFSGKSFEHWRLKP